MPTSSTIPSSCPFCGAPAGKGAVCEFCGSALARLADKAPAPRQERPRESSPDPVEDWMREPPPQPAPQPSAPERAEPFTPPPPPSGLEPVSLALNEAARAGRGIGRRLLTACLSGCLVSVIAFLGCGLVSYMVFNERFAQGNFPYLAVLIGLAGAFAGGLLVTLLVFFTRK